ncbi:MAG: hypothetical protein DMF53_23430 [Acidobacteria bacterium]|nr:MAG: hypothetical protein DMF53_23430 [Acidobacteriota bacterium]
MKHPAFAVWASLSIASLLLSGCVVNTALQAEKAEPAGSVTLRSRTLGDRTLKPTACQSGEHQLFLGADFFDHQETGQGIATRLIVEPAGAVILRFFDVAHPLDPGVLFRRQDCGRFELSLDRTGWKINDVYDLHVSLDFDCRNASGDTAAGHLATDHCH